MYDENVDEGMVGMMTECMMKTLMEGMIKWMIKGMCDLSNGVLV